MPTPPLPQHLIDLAHRAHAAGAPAHVLRGYVVAHVQREAAREEAVEHAMALVDALYETPGAPKVRLWTGLASGGAPRVYFPVGYVTVDADGSIGGASIQPGRRRQALTFSESSLYPSQRQAYKKALDLYRAGLVERAEEQAMARAEQIEELVAALAAAVAAVAGEEDDEHIERQAERAAWQEAHEGGWGRENPIPARDPTFSLDPYEWVAGTVLEDYCDEDDAGFFHVTTRGAKVFEEGRLRSRSDVGVIGLGGGRIDPGKHVSVVINYSRACWLYDAIKNLSRTCKRGTAVDVVKLVLDWTGFPHNNWSLAFDDDPEEGATWPVDLLEFIYEIGMTNVGGEGDYGRHDLTTRKGWDALLAEEGAEVNKKWNTPGKRYKLAQFMEDRLESTFYHEDWWDGGICVPLVGFTAAPAEFLRIDPDDVTIVQVALRETVGLVEDIPRECELRLPPANIQIVAVGCEDARNRLPVLPRDG